MTREWLRRHRVLLGSLAGATALLLVAVAGTGYLMLRHFNDNITQVNLSAMLSRQPADTSPQAENILVVGADTDLAGLSGDVTAGQPDTIMLLHIAGDKKSAEVVSVPRASWVSIPSCETAHGGMSAATRARVGVAFTVAGQQAGATAYNAACLVKTLEQDTGIYIDHYIEVNLDGFQSMVSALGGVTQCVQAGLTDPATGVTLKAGCYHLTPAQALAYLRARTGSGQSYREDLNRIAREQSLVTALFSEVRTDLLNPEAVLKFANAVTSSLTTDSKFGGVSGLYHLATTLRGIPAGQVTQFTVPNRPRAAVVPSDTTDVLWTQPQAKKIFAALRADKPVSKSLYSG